MKKITKKKTSILFIIQIGNWNLFLIYIERRKINLSYKILKYVEFFIYLLWKFYTGILISNSQIFFQINYYLERNLFD